MASKPKSGPQDMPPPGGYKPIQTVRVGIRRLISPTLASALAASSLWLGGAAFIWAYKDVAAEQVEMQSARHVIWALLLAERDRAVMKQMRRNRDEERELMKDYPGWEVGTYFGEPIYQGQPPEEFIEPIFEEYVAHTDFKDTGARYFRNLAT